MQKHEFETLTGMMVNEPTFNHAEDIYLNAGILTKEEVCKEIRACLREMYGAKSARAVSILYGGSLNANNAREIFEQYDIDGALVGGASLKAQDFLKIIEIGAEIIGK